MWCLCVCVRVKFNANSEGNCRLLPERWHIDWKGAITAVCSHTDAQTMSVRHLAAIAYWKKCSVHATLRCILCEPNKDWDLFGSWEYFLIHLTRLDRKGKNNKNCHPRKIMEIYWIHGISPVGRPCHHCQDTLQTPNWWILKLTNETDRQQVGESGRNSPGMMISLLLIDTYSIVACLGASSHTYTLSWDLIELPIDYTENLLLLNYFVLYWFRSIENRYCDQICEAEP